MRLCGFPGCDRIHSSRGYCAPHAAQDRKGDGLRPLRRSHGPFTRKTQPCRAVRPVSIHPADPSVALVLLQDGRFAIVDAVDAIEVGKFNWFARDAGGPSYPYRSVYWKDEHGRHQKYEPLHRFVGRLAGLELSEWIDHRNGNGLDCRRQNLRDATAGQNGANRRMSSANKSGIKGVFWNEPRQRWIGRVACGDRLWIKRFKTIEEAAAAVERARVQLHGEFANHGKETIQ